MGNCLASPPPPTGPPVRGRPRAWLDAFHTLDYWAVERSWNGAGRGEEQEFSPHNVKLYPGPGVVITVRREASSNGREYTSGKLVSTRGLHHGTVRFTAVLPYRDQMKGLVAALRLVPREKALGLGSLLGNDSFPHAGLIDVMVVRGTDPGIVRGSAHFGAHHEVVGGRVEANVCDGEPHSFSVRWDATGMRWSLDGEPYARVAWCDVFPPGAEDVDPYAPPRTWPKDARGRPMCNPFLGDTDFVPVISLGVGGSIEANLPPPENLPATLRVLEVTVVTFSGSSSAAVLARASHQSAPSGTPPGSPCNPAATE